MGEGPGRRTGRLTALGLAFDDQHDDVVVQVGRGDRLMQPVRRTGPVAPPAGRSAADDVRSVDDQHSHAASLGSRSGVLGADIVSVSVDLRLPGIIEMALVACACFLEGVFPARQSWSTR